MKQSYSTATDIANTKRPHTTLSFKAPGNFEAEYYTQRSNFWTSGSKQTDYPFLIALFSFLSLRLLAKGKA